MFLEGNVHAMAKFSLEDFDAGIFAVCGLAASATRRTEF